MVTIRKPKNALKFSQPAAWWGSVWREALPCGNGVVGAAVYGGAANDVVMINHSDLWWQGHVGVLQDVADKLKDVRKKMDEKSPKEAEDILANSLISKGYRPQLSYPLPLCDFHIDMKLDKYAKEYSRILNMETAEVSVSFKDGSTRFDRSMFVSRAQNLIVYEITRAGNKAIDATLSLSMHDKFNARTPSAVSKLPDGITTKYENYFMYFSARSDNGTEFGVVARIHFYGGTQVVNSDSITVKGAEKVIIFLIPFIESQREKEWKALKATLTSIKSTYEKLLKEHLPLHSKLFNSAELDLDASGRDEFADDLLRDSFVGGELPPALIEKLWAYGRYLMVCGSSPTSLPCVPYGLWCGDFKAPSSQVSAAGSLQTLYSHVLEGNLGDYLLSVFTYYESVIDDLRKNASRLYASRGIFIPTVMAHGTGVLGSVDSNVIHFTGVAGWVAQLFYDYYLFTDDIKFLKTRALPFMKEVAMFYENFLKVQGDSLYESSPSYSPDTTPGNYTNNGADTLKIAKNASIDFAIAKQLLKNLVDGSELASMNKSDIPKWKDMLTRIPSYQLNEDGTVREFMDSSYTDNLQSNSTSLFYPVFPGVEVDEKNPELLKSFNTTAKKKIYSSNTHTGVSLARYANIFARLGEGNTAMEILSSLTRSMAMNNLVYAASDWKGMGSGQMETWANYTIEPNMAVTSAIQEMILQSDEKTIKLLPAICDVMYKGEVNGLQTRTGVEVVSLAWDKKKGVMIAKLKSRKATAVSLQLPSGSKKFKSISSEVFEMETGKVTNLELPAGKIVTLDVRF